VADRTPHRCDERCVCLVHDTPLFYAPSADLHACQDPTCEHAQGLLSEVSPVAWFARYGSGVHASGLAGGAFSVEDIDPERAREAFRAYGVSVEEAAANVARNLEGGSGG
jgi:hypothetical protein